MNEFEYLVIGRDPKNANKPYIVRQRTFDTREEAVRYAYTCPSYTQPQVVALVRHPARAWGIEGPYPFCSTPALCRDAGYCKRDPACDN